MAKRFSQLRLKSMKNLQGKRQSKKEQQIKTSMDDLYSEDEVIQPKVIQSFERSQVPYTLRSVKTAQKEQKNAKKYLSKIDECKQTVKQSVVVDPIDIWGGATESLGYAHKQQSVNKRIFNLDASIALNAVSSSSYNPDKKLHQSALNQVLTQIIDEKIDIAQAKTKIPRTVSNFERNHNSMELFQQLLADDYEEVQVLPNEITQDKIEFQLNRQKEVQFLEQLQSLKQQLDNSASNISQDKVQEFIALRRDLYKELHNQLPQYRTKYDFKMDQRHQYLQIKKILEEWTPEKVQQASKLNEILKYKKLFEKLNYSGHKKQLDTGIATTDQLTGSLRTTLGNNVGVQDQLNVMYQNGKVSGKFRSGKVPKQYKFKVGYKWWNK